MRTKQQLYLVPTYVFMSLVLTMKIKRQLSLVSTYVFMNLFLSTLLCVNETLNQLIGKNFFFKKYACQLPPKAFVV